MFTKFFAYICLQENEQNMHTLFFPIKMMVAFNKLLTPKHDTLIPKVQSICGFYLSQLLLNLRV